MKKYLFVVILLITLSYGKTLQMYFWQDDSALIFRLQNPIGAMGSFGTSIFGDRGAYRYMVIPFVPFYPVFGLNPTGYFFGGLVTYFVAVMCFWLFAKEIFKNKQNILISVAIFSAGYIGSDMMFRIINSWQSNTGLILGILSLYFYAKFINKSRLKFYFLALLFYLASIELVYIRSHSLLLSLLALEILNRPVSIKRSIIRAIPFVILFYYWYLTDQNFGSTKLPNISMFTSLFATIGNSLLPDKISGKIILLYKNNTPYIFLISIMFPFLYLIKKINKSKKILLLAIGLNLSIFVLNYFLYSQEFFWYKTLENLTSTTIGLLLTFNILFLGLLTLNRKDNIGKLLIIGYLMLSSQIFGYFKQYPTSVFSTTHRYLYFAIIGYCLIYTSLFTLFGKKIKTLLFILLIATNLLLGVKYQSEIIKDRSYPASVFYKMLLSNVPNIEKGSIFYFDVSDKPYYQKQFSDFFSVGSMPESTALAIYYGLDRDDILFLTNFDELMSILSSDPGKVKNTYAFYYGELGLINNTNGLRTLLEKVDNTIHPSYVELSFNASISIDTSNATETKSKLSQADTDLLLSYLQSRTFLSSNLKIETLSEWKFQEKEYATDGNLETSWRGHRIYWDDNEHDSIVITLPNNSLIDRVVWTNWISSLAPTSYSIDVSQDAQSWENVYKTKQPQPKGPSERTVVNFKPVMAKYVRMDIEDTLTNDSPAISEFEVVESKYNKISLDTVDKFLSSPFSLVANPPAKFSKIKATIKTDKGDTTTTIPVSRYGSASPYKVYLQLGGTQIKDIQFTVLAPLKILTSEVKTRSLSLEEMTKLGLVKKFSKN